MYMGQGSFLNEVNIVAHFYQTPKIIKEKYQSQQERSKLDCSKGAKRFTKHSFTIEEAEAEMKKL